MSVAELARRIRNLSSPAELGSGSDDDVTRLLHALEPFSALPVDSFLQLLAKVKVPKPAPTRPPKKTLEEVERERQEKENKKLEASRVKAEQKANAEAEKRRKAERAAHAKLAAEAEKKKQKELELRQKRESEDRAVRDAINELNALLGRFRGGHVPQEVVDPPLERLKALSAVQLLAVARAVNAAATLTEKSTKAKVLKQITDMVKRVWKTSDNVHH